LRLPATCFSPLRKSPGRMEFQRGHFQHDTQGGLSVTVCGNQGSHRLSGMSRANCFIVLPADCAGVQPGDLVDIEPLHDGW